MGRKEETFGDDDCSRFLRFYNYLLLVIDTLPVVFLLLLRPVRPRRVLT